MVHPRRIFRGIVSGVLGFVVALSAAGYSPAADRVELESGEVLFGTLLRMNEQEVSLRLASGGVLSFRLNQVSRVKLDALTAKETARTLGLQLSGHDVVMASGGVTDTPSGTRAADTKPSPESADRKSGTPPWPRTPGPLLATPVTPVIVGFEPPKGFQAENPEALSESVLESYVDPSRGATCTVDRLPSQAPLETLKRRLTHANASSFSSFRVLRDEHIGNVDREAWVVEIEAELEGKHALHQLQVFTRIHGEAFVLTYRAPQDSWDELAKAIRKSVATVGADLGSSGR